MNAAKRTGLGFFFLGMLFSCAWANIAPPGSNTVSAAPTKPLRSVRFIGYQQINGAYVYQLQFVELPPPAQPPLKRTGDALGLGDYVIGAFHPGAKADASTLELDDPNTGVKLTLKYRESVGLP